MTAPIPLSSPSGLVYAYACGHCHHVSASSALVYRPDEPGPIASLVESSLRDAARCCICRECGCVTDDRRRQCPTCTTWMRFCRSWTELGMIIAAGHKTLDDYNRWLRSDENAP